MSVYHYKCFDKDGRLVGTILAEDESKALGLAQKRNPAVVRATGHISAIVVPAAASQVLASKKEGEEVVAALEKKEKKKEAKE